jgi:hypothetical protein
MALALVVLFSLASPRAHADTLSPSILSLFPKNASELAYSDFAHVRQFPWFAQFKRQTLPTGFSELDAFLSSINIDPNRQIDQLAWALIASDSSAVPSSPHQLPANDDLLGIALGNFDTPSAEALLEKNKTPSIVSAGYTFYPCGPACHGFYFLFLDSGTIAFGKPSLLLQMLQVRSGAQESILANPLLYPLIRQVNGSGIFWGVLNDAGTRAALLQLLPEAGNFPDVSKLISKMHAMTIAIDGQNELDAVLNVSATPDDALQLSQLLQAALLYRQFQTAKDDPQFAKILQNISVVPAGPGLQITFSLTSDQMVSLLQHNTFSPKI